MPMELLQNEHLRLHNWHEFRSSSRDHMIPITSGGRVVQKFRLGAAMPVPGVDVGVTLPVVDREAIAEERKVVEREVARVGDMATGAMQYISFFVDGHAVEAVVGGFTQATLNAGVVPFDGFLREFVLDIQAVADSVSFVAVRVSSGGTLFRGHPAANPAISPSVLLPDFARVPAGTAGPASIVVRNGRIPVYAGDQVIVVVRAIGPSPAPIGSVSGLIGVEAVDLRRFGAVVSTSANLAFRDSSVRVTEESTALVTRLAIERERTERARLAAEDRARRAVERGIERTVAAREPVRVPPPTFGTGEPLSPDGKGKTFVQAWQPQHNSIGYMIPDPPRGGRVTVFDDRYTIWDVTGRNVGTGKVEVVRSTDAIPAESRISRNLGVIPSPALPVGVGVGPGFVGGHVVTPPGRVRPVFVPGFS